MQNETQLNVDEIMERIRERARAKKQGNETAISPPRPTTHIRDNGRSAANYNFDRLRREVAQANQSHNLVGTINPRPKGLHNDLVQFFKRGMRRMLTWYTRPLHEFHGAVARSLNETLRAMEVGQSRVTNLEQELAIFRNLLGEHRKVADETRTRLEARIQTQEEMVRTQQENIEQKLRVSERNSRRLSYLLNEQRPTTGALSTMNESKLEESTPHLQFDYFVFEERFRGKEAEIRARQQGYVEYFRGRSNVIDLGCGRGEFLELLRENDIKARGVESGIDQFLLCQEKKLEVAHENLFSYLEQQPDAFLGGIFSAQVIEHLPVALQFRLVDLCKQKLSSGSPLVIETINPECLYALARNFYLDPTHVRPVHPEMLKFVLETAGFERVELKFSAPAADGPLPSVHFNGNPSETQRFNELFHRLCTTVLGFQDYAAIARR